MCRKIYTATSYPFLSNMKFITIAGSSVSRLLPIANFCLVLVYEFPFRQYCLALNRASHVPSIKTRRFRLCRRFHYSCRSQFQNIYTYHCDAYHCYSVYASPRFEPRCPTECGDWENVHVQIGTDMHDFYVLACLILYDHRDTVYKFNNRTFYAV